MNQAVSLTDALSEGTYEATFSYAFPFTVKAPVSTDLLGWHLSLDTYQVNQTAGTTFIRWSATKFRGATGQWSTEAVPIVGIALGAIVGLFGLALAYLTLSKLEKVVDNPSVSIALVAAAIIALWIIFKQL